MQEALRRIQEGTSAEDIILGSFTSLKTVVGFDDYFELADRYVVDPTVDVGPPE